MISINCDVDEIQTAIDTYRMAADQVDDAIDLVVASVHDTRLEWGLWWISNFAYMKVLSLLNQNQSVDELIEDLTGLPVNFKYYEDGEYICNELETYIFLTTDDTNHFLLSGYHLDFVCFFCGIDATVIESEGNYAEI